ncbi:MAG: ROK family protein [Saprospiraceae bacterium]|nr:ROK family protein [Saprospiraceae bacterium]
MEYKWGIDLGGTKVEGVILDAQNDYKVIKRMRLPTEQTMGYEHILEQIKSLIDQLKSSTGLTPEKIGMGTPGTIDPVSGRLKNSNTQCLIGQTIKKDIEQLVNVPFVVTNDANCFAMAETRLGAVSELEELPSLVFGVIMGTGVGGGVVLNGNIINGRHGIGGEWGHNVLDPNGTECYCGKIGCVEKVIAGPALERFYQELSNENRSLKEIYAQYNSGVDPAAQATIQHLVENFGKAISVVINILDPEVIVMGGGVNNIKEVVLGAKEAAIPYVFNKEVRTKFLSPKLGDSAGVFGAALLV